MNKLLAIQLGKYLLSDERKGRTHPELQKDVTHADLENFKDVIDK